MLEARECSLCREALRQSPDKTISFLKDNNPTTPNRWLALPREHYASINPLAAMTSAERTEVRDAAISQAHDLWGDDWAIAMNGDLSRTQCHPHVHIGKLLPGNESGNAVLRSKSDFFVDLWFHPEGGRLHVHEGAQVNETVLMR